MLQTAVMCTTLVCLTVLGVAGAMDGHDLALIFTGVAGVVFGAAGATVAANGAAHAAVTAVLDNSDAVDVQGHAATSQRRGR